MRCRVIKNGFAKNLLDMAQKKVDPWETMKYGVGRIRKAYVEGDLEQELIESIVSESEGILESIQKKILPFKNAG